ncbi:hypothetical protein B4096_0965 [Heyndrickxia coagulans]|nr:hypothetical protein B4096_0965 [Heyndrickxia coagulans]
MSVPTSKDIPPVIFVRNHFESRPAHPGRLSLFGMHFKFQK